MLCFTLADKLATALVVENMRPPDPLAKPATCRARETLNAAIVPNLVKEKKRRK